MNIQRALKNRMVPRTEETGLKLPSRAADRYIVKRQDQQWVHTSVEELPKLIGDGVELAVWEDRTTANSGKDGSIQGREIFRINKGADSLLSEVDDLSDFLDAPELPKTLDLSKPVGRNPGDSYNDIIKEIGNGGYDAKHYTVRVAPDFEKETILGLSSMKAEATQDLDSFSLDFLPFPYLAVEVNGEAATYKHDKNELNVTPKKPIKDGEEFDVDVLYQGAPHEVKESFVFDLPFGMRFVEGALVTISEPRSTRGWFPCNDHPSDKATFDFELGVPLGYEAHASGLQQSEKHIEGGNARQLDFSPKDPMAPYVVALNAFKSEDFESWTQVSSRGVPIENSVPIDSNQSAKDTLNKTPQILDFLESFLGDYPFEVLGNHNFKKLFGGAFEAQTRNVYTQRTMESQRVDLEGPVIHFPTEVVAHETAHQWFGDSVSIGRWRDIWMKEAFATYFGAAYAAHDFGVDLDQHMSTRYERARNRVSGYIPGDPETQKMYSGDAYNLMAGGVHALRKELGDGDFKKVLKTFLTDYAGDSAEITDFVATCEETTGKDLKAFFNKWVYAEHLPKRLPE